MATRTLLFAFGGSVQNEQGVVVLDSKHTLDAIKFMTELYQKTMTQQVMDWDASSNNRAMLSGTISLCLNAFSLTLDGAHKTLPVTPKIKLTQSLTGPYPPF